MTIRTSTQAVRDRLEAVRELLQTWDVDGVLITSASNRRWLSGFAGSAGQLLVTADEALLATDFRYWEQAAAQAPAWRLVRQKGLDNDLKDFVTSAGSERIGVEAAYLTLAEYEKLQSVEEITWQPLASTLEPMRMVKTEGEFELIRAAARAADAAMSQVPNLARPNMSERALAWELEMAIREAGADNVAFPPLVASGANSALPHHRPGDRLLQSGDTLIVDIGAEIQGYLSDLTRTFYLGDAPSDEFRRVYGVVESAQTTVLERATAGMDAMQMDALARNHIIAAGFGEQFGHGLGHGIGLDVHERPFLSARPSAKELIIPAGCVVAIEPGIYLPGWGGIRIEDMVRFTESGSELISQCPKVPIIPT